MPKHVRRTVALVLSTAAASLLALAAPALAEKRIAFVVGNGAYTNAAALANPVNDASDVAAALEAVGFDVILGLDLDKRGFDTRLRDFARALPDAGAALFYYAGHGLQVAGRNHLLPVDAELRSEPDLDFEAVSLDLVLRQMERGREAKTNVVVLDACRDNPLARNLARSMGTRSAAVQSGLAQVETGVGTFIAYSTQPGHVALDGSGRNSPFTGAFASAITRPGRNLTAIMIEVRKQVLAATGGKQVPWDHSSLTGDFYFQLAAAPGGVPPALSSPAPGAGGEVLQQRVRQLEEELERRPDARRTAAIARIEQLKERARRLEQESRDDQQRIFETYRRSGSSGDAGARNETSREVGRIQVQMVRRNREREAVLEEIRKLEMETGSPGGGQSAAQ